jgi:hypothetical protein
VWAILGAAFCYIYVYNFFQTWFHTFLVKGRGVTEGGLLLSALPFVVAVAANFAGGAASDACVRRFGPTAGRRAVGAVSLFVAAVLVAATMFTTQPMLTVVLLALAYGAITFQQSGVFGVCLDVGGVHAGAMVGLMNTVASSARSPTATSSSAPAATTRRSCRWSCCCSRAPPAGCAWTPAARSPPSPEPSRWPPGNFLSARPSPGPNPPPPVRLSDKGGGCLSCIHLIDPCPHVSRARPSRY